jgi:cytochrome c oxidase subunit IV
MSQPVVSAKTYLLTWITLLGLTLLTSLLGLANLGSMSLAVALIIAAIKASLIAAVFMHALFDTKLVRVAIAGGILMLCILMGLTLGDYMTRGWLPFPGK